MKKVIVILIGLFFSYQSFASSITLKCQGEVFYSKDRLFEVVISDGTSFIEFVRDEDEQLAYFTIKVASNSDNSSFYITTEEGVLYMSIDINEEEGKMISLYENPWDYKDKNPYSVTGTCRILK